MVEYMKSVAESSTADLTLEERNLLSVAYKNVVGARRASLRIIGSIESKEKEKNSANAQLVTNYKGKVEEELNKICQDILSLLEENLINKATNQGSPEAIVFYQKMKAGAIRSVRGEGRAKASWWSASEFASPAARALSQPVRVWEHRPFVLVDLHPFVCRPHAPFARTHPRTPYRLLPLPRRVCAGHDQGGALVKRRAGVQGGDREGDRARPHPPNSPRPRPQLLGFPVRGADQE